MVMSVIAHALLKERALYQDALNNDYNGDRERLFEKYPQARGFLREPQKLYTKREQAMSFLDQVAKEHIKEMKETLDFSK